MSLAGSWPRRRPTRLPTEQWRSSPWHLWLTYRHKRSVDTPFGGNHLKNKHLVDTLRRHSSLCTFCFKAGHKNIPNWSGNTHVLFFSIFYFVPRYNSYRFIWCLVVPLLLCCSSPGSLSLRQWLEPRCLWRAWLPFLNSGSNTSDDVHITYFFAHLAHKPQF